jgi:hypothetical protein
MLDATTLSAMFRSGDSPEGFRPRRLAQYFVVTATCGDPSRCLDVYADLLARGGTAHAAELFRMMVARAQRAPGEFREAMLRGGRVPILQNR